MFKIFGLSYIQAEGRLSVRVGCLACLQHIQVRVREPSPTRKRQSYCKGVSLQSSPALASVVLVLRVCLFIPTTPTPVLAPHQRTHILPFSLHVWVSWDRWQSLTSFSSPVCPDRCTVSCLFNSWHIVGA